MPTLSSAGRTLLVLAAFAVVLLAAIHCALVSSRGLLRAFEERATTNRARPLQIEARLRRMAPGQVPVIVVGSSVAASDVDKPLLAARLGLDPSRVALLALPAATPLETAMLEPAIERVRPLLVVYPATLWALLGDPEWQSARVYDPRIALPLFGWRDLLRDREAHASGILGWLHFGIRHRTALRQVAAAALPWAADLGPPPDPERLRFDDRIALAQRMNAIGGAQRESLACPSVHTRALGLMARRLAARGSLLVIAATPVNHRFQQDGRLRALFDGCFAGAAPGSGFAYTPFASMPAATSGDFLDENHLNEQGRERYTEALAGHLRPLLDGGAAALQ